MTGFKDHFSGHAASYRAGRPSYPPALFSWLAQQCSSHRLAWDVGCGNGQASFALAAHFERVLATDPSAAQVANATTHPRIDYRVERAERSSAADESVDLLTAAQALHWFDLERYFAEAKRVAKPSALIAAFGYGVLRVSEDVESALEAFHAEVEAHWPPERAIVAAHYTTIDFPFVEIEFPDFAMACDWTLTQLVEYLETWSAVVRCRSATGRDPIPPLRRELEAVWGAPERTERVEWPLFGRVGRVLRSGGVLTGGGARGGELHDDRRVVR